MRNYCLPIQCGNSAQVFQLIQENRSFYRFFEVWLGAIQDVEDDFVPKLSEQCGDALVIVLRTKGLEITLPLARRKFFMAQAAKCNSLLDLDITTQRPEIRHLEKTNLNVRTILSYHNYETTPPLRKLRSIASWMGAHQAAVSKIAAFCQSPADALRLLEIGLELHGAGRDYIVLGMGPHGAVTRVFGTLWGNKMIFAPREGGAPSAPGQLSMEQLEKIYSTLSR
jgi:3-dehydroquinate dehydratase I